MNRIISLFLFIFIASCLNGQYNSPIKNKVTLGVQTTADGLVFRGVANIDTVAATSKITRANKSDTSTFILLDTITNLLWHYKTTSNRWLQAGGSTLDTATMLLPYYRAGRNTIIQAADVPTLNQNTTGSAATLTTGRTVQTNLATTVAATFNGSANISPGVTGVLPVANGGTGSAMQNFVDLSTVQTVIVGGIKTFDDTIIVNRGIRFSATQAASTNANTLDDYEEGTFTSTLTAILNCSLINVTSTYYLKIGGYVYYSITGTLTITASNAATALLYSPPFAQSTLTDNQGGTIAINRTGGNFSLGAVLDNSPSESRVAATIPAVLQTFSGASNFYINGALRAN